MDGFLKLIVGIFKVIFEGLLKKPYKEKETYKDVGHKEPKNPDSVFSDSDW